MSDQSFSAKNFRKIFDYENRKGNNLERAFFSEEKKITSTTEEIKKTMKLIKDNERAIKSNETRLKEHNRNKKTMTASGYKTIDDMLHKQKIRLGDCKEKLESKKNELKNKKEELLMKKFEKISTSAALATDDGFEVSMEKVTTQGGKLAYKLDFSNNCALYFITKQIQYNLHKIYKLKQDDRYNIVCQLREILSDPFPKLIIRTDIKSFYESIPREKILRKLNEDSLLPPASKKIIARIFHEYYGMTGNIKGLPRGVGISAYLSELYMRPFDSKIKSNFSPIYYARYVDDIIIIYSDKIWQNDSSALSKARIRIKNEIKKYASELDLCINTKKTNTRIIDKRKSKRIDYLGYKFQIKNGIVEILLSKSKIDKYKERIVLAFQEYQKFMKINKPKASSILLKRIKFLTINTRLTNNKSNVAVGIYFSNSLITNTSSLESLDKFLKKEIRKNSSTLVKKSKERLSKFSFVKGFEERKFYEFSTNELEDIMKVWKHGT